MDVSGSRNDHVWNKYIATQPPGRPPLNRGEAETAFGIRLLEKS